MGVGAIGLGVALLVISALVVRYRAPLARWEIATRITALRRSSLSNSEYLEREIDALKTPDSERLSRWLTTLVSTGIAVTGVFAIVAGLAGN